MKEDGSGLYFIILLEQNISGRDIMQFLLTRTGRSQRASTEENKASEEESLIRRIRRILCLK